MQTLQEHLDRLALTHLSNTSLISEQTGEIRETALTTVISAFNTAILNVYNRVNLENKTIWIHGVPNLLQYKLDDKYTFRLKNLYEDEQDPLDPDYEPYPHVVYIEEREDLFTNDLLSVKSLIDASGKPFKALFKEVGTLTLNFDKLPENWVCLTYRSRGPVIPLDVEINTNLVLNIPNIAIPAIDAYTAYESFFTLGSAEAMNKVRDYMMKYEQAITYLTEHLINDDEQITSDNFRRNGWV